MATTIERRNADNQITGYQAQVRRAGVSKSKTFRRKTDAERWARETEVAADQKVFVDRTEAERTTLKMLLERYLDEVAVTHRGAHIERYMLQSVLRDPVAETRLVHLSTKDMAELRGRMVKAGLASATINRKLGLIAAAINVAKREWGIHLAENVAAAKLTTRPRLKNARERRLAADEAERLFAEIAKLKNLSIPITALTKLAIETACRQGELCSLGWSDINLKARVATVRGLSGEGSKNGEIRKVPLSSEAIEAIRSLPRRLGDDRLLQHDQETLKKTFAKCVRRAGIDNLTFHDLRHEATSRLAKIYTNPLELMRITGHKTLGMLARYYHADAEELAKRLA